MDTGAELSLISNRKYEELKRNESNIRETNGNPKDMIQELPIQKITIIGATGKRNNSARKQICVNVTCNHRIIPFTFIVCDNIKVDMLIGCDNLRRYSTVIDLAKTLVIFNLSKQLITTPIKWQKTGDSKMEGELRYEPNNRGDGHIWNGKVQEIKDFQSSKLTVTEDQKQRLIDVYQKHK